MRMAHAWSGRPRGAIDGRQARTAPTALDDLSARAHGVERAGNDLRALAPD